MQPDNRFEPDGSSGTLSPHDLRRSHERTLVAFDSEAAAVAACEGLDVEAADWLFWEDLGNPLEPLFSVPNKRGLSVVQNGIYSLVPAKPDHHADLNEALDAVLNFESPPPFHNAESVRDYVARRASSGC